jgi:hypothetical protein
MLANHKGAQLVASVAVAANPQTLEIQVIGDTEATFPDAARDRMKIHGPYREGELPALLAKYRPHVIWFPAAWPETYSFTLSAAIEAGLPVVATDIGAFPERLTGRPFTWLLPPTLDPAAWLGLFDTVAEALRKTRPTPPGVAMRPGTPNIPAATQTARRRGPALVDLRRDGMTSVLVIPEAFEDGSFTPCAHIRLLRPLDHPATGQGLATTIADADGASRYHCDVIVTQRHALASVTAAEKLAAHAKRIGATLIYDLDDDLLTLPPEHPEAAELQSKAAVVEYLLRQADIVRTSTDRLAARVAPLARRMQVVGNALDERIWLPHQRGQTDRYGAIRLLCMGTATHDADFALVLPALTEIHRQFGDQIQVDVIGFVSETSVPAWIRRLAPSQHAMRSYPGFVHWISRAGPWDIGLAPLVDNAFNTCKSAIKTLDHAALGVASLASDVAAYRGSPADGPGGRLVPNTTAEWYEALSLLIRDAALRRNLAEGGVQMLRCSGTLASQADIWFRAWPRAGSGPGAPM